MNRANLCMCSSFTHTSSRMKLQGLSLFARELLSLHIVKRKEWAAMLLIIAYNLSLIGGQTTRK